MAEARLTIAATVTAETTFRSKIIDPFPEYPRYGGDIAADLLSGGLELSFSQGYARPERIHEAIATLRRALDQLDEDVDAAIVRQAQAIAGPASIPLPDGVAYIGSLDDFLDGIGEAPGTLTEAWGK